MPCCERVTCSMTVMHVWGRVEIVCIPLMYQHKQVIFLLFYSENAILEGEDHEGIYSFVALSAHYIGLNVTQCRYLHCNNNNNNNKYYYY